MNPMRHFAILSVAGKKVHFTMVHEDLPKKTRELEQQSMMNVTNMVQCMVQVPMLTHVMSKKTYDLHHSTISAMYLIPKHIGL
jgi:DNA-binding protein Fis